MPGFDGTGPRGMGPMTGGMRGWCSGFMPRPWSVDGRWPSYGYPSAFPPVVPRYTPYPATAWPQTPMTVPAPTWAPPTSQAFPMFQPYSMPKDQEIDYLQNQAKILEDQLKQIRDRLKELASSE